MLSPEEIDAFKSLVLEVYEIELDDDEAAFQAEKLAELFQLQLEERKKLIVIDEQKVIINDEQIRNE